jgi:hypothetical protein
VYYISSFSGFVIVPSVFCDVYLLIPYPKEIINQYFSIIGFFMITLFARLYVRVGSLLKCGKHLHDGIISLGDGLDPYN